MPAEPHDQDSERTPTALTLKPWYIAIAIVASAWLVIPAVALLVLNDLTKAGALGDAFGSANALFSAIAFAALAYTVLLQREELRLQRHELEMTRQELSRTATAQEQASKTLNGHSRIIAVTARVHALTTLIAQAERRRELAPTTNALLRQQLEKQVESHLGEIRTAMNALKSIEETHEYTTT